MTEDVYYEARKASDGQWYWVICSAGNDAVLATSETYTERNDAVEGAKTAGAEDVRIAEDA